jgi:hypothetical protein
MKGKREALFQKGGNNHDVIVPWFPHYKNWG